MEIVIGLGAILGVVLGAIGIFKAVGGAVAWFRKRKETPPAQLLLAEQKESNRLLQEIVAGLSPADAPQPRTEELAAEATAETERMLEEALAFVDEGRYRDAIDHVLTAYDRDLPPRAKAQLHLVAGNAFYSLSDYGAAETHFRESLRAARSAGATAAAKGSLGRVHEHRGDLDNAEKQYQEAGTIQERIGDRRGLSATLGNLGNVYFRRRALDKAEEHHRKALAIDEEIGDRLAQADDLTNLGTVYAERGDSERAEEHYRKALDIHEEIGSKLGQAVDLGNLGLAHARRGDLGHAEEYHRKALAIDKEIGNRFGEAQDLGNLGSVYADRGDFEGADEHYRSALNIAEEIGARSLVSWIRDLLEDLKATDD